MTEDRHRAEAVSVPDGWKLVPIEPLPGMIDAACMATVLGEGEDDEPVHLEPREARIAYASMLAAAPTLPSPAVPVKPEPVADEFRAGMEEAYRIAIEQAGLMSDLVIEGEPENARQREAMEAALTRFAQKLKWTLEAFTSPPDDAKLREEVERLRQLLRSAEAEIRSQHAQHLAYVDRAVGAAKTKVRKEQERCKAVAISVCQYRQNPKLGEEVAKAMHTDD